MILSVIPVAALALLWWSITYNPQEQQTRPAEVEPVAAYAAQQVDHPLWLPEPGDGWTPTVAWFDDRVEDIPTWHVSFATPQGEYVALHQAADVTPEWEQTVLASGQEAGTESLGTPVGERTWTRYEGPRPSNAEQAWVLGPQETDGSTVVVSATAELDEAELTDFLDSIELQD